MRSLPTLTVCTVYVGIIYLVLFYYLVRTQNRHSITAADTSARRQFQTNTCMMFTTFLINIVTDRSKYQYRLYCYQFISLYSTVWLLLYSTTVSVGECRPNCRIESDESIF